MFFWEWVIRSTIPALLFSYSIMEYLFEGKFVFVPISVVAGIITIAHYFFDLKSQKELEKDNSIRNGAWVGAFVSFSSVLFFIVIMVFINL